MSSTVGISIDTTPPGNPAIVVNGGALTTATQPATVHISTADYITGANDVADMKIWGDVDIADNPDIQTFEGDSAWIPFAVNTDIALGSIPGRKRLYARLRDSLGNTTPAFGTYIDYNPALPVVTMIVPPLVAKVSLVAGHDEITFTWESSTDFVEYVVRSMPTSASPYFGGSPIGSAHGSVNVAGTGSFPGATPLQTTVKSADLVAASPGDGAKILKVFVKDSVGNWSP